MDRKTLISNYFLGNLSEEENKEFKELLETDSDFKREVVFQERVKRAIAYKNHSKLKQQLQGFENKFKVSRTRKIWWFGAAASIVVLIVSSIMLFNFNYTNDELFATYFEAPKNIVHPIVRGNTVNNDMTIAFVAYQKEDYIKAQNMFESLFNKTNNSELLFYQSISLIELGRLNEAIAKLKMHKNYNDALSTRTSWYLALTYLKTNQTESCKKELLEIISDKSAFHYQEAKDLLKKI